MNTHLKLTSFKTTAHSSKIGFFQGHLWISGQWLLSRPLHWIIQEFNSPWYSLQNDSFQDQLHTVEILASFKIIWGFYFIFGATDVFQDHLKRKKHNSSGPFYSYHWISTWEIPFNLDIFQDHWKKWLFDSKPSIGKTGYTGQRTSRLTIYHDHFTIFHELYINHAYLVPFQLLSRPS